MLRKKNASNVKLQSSINEMLTVMQTSSTLSVRKNKEPQITSAKHSNVTTKTEQPKKEMNEDEKMRKLRESFEAMGKPVTVDRNM